MSANRAAEAVRLRDDEGLDADQIARRLGIGKTIAYRLIANGGKTTNCRGCGVEIPVHGRSGLRKWCSTCGGSVSPRRKSQVDEEEMDAAVLRVADQARRAGNARPAPGPVAVRHDPSIVKPHAYPDRHCRERSCRKAFTPHAPRQAFCPECRRR